ncbi:MAG: ISNCY family transposase [Candidatus Levybacteria bacterium]|nr:ISNCY family transposase [Candidatus Levybacteria bacterium]
MSDRPILSNEEQQKLEIIKATIQRKITNGQAAKMLCVSSRQVKRLKKAIKTQGDEAIIHKLKGRKSNHCIDLEVKENLLKKIKETYSDFKPGFATEKLQEQYDTNVTSQTIRLWMTEKGLWKPHKQKKTGKYRSWRPRKEYFGEFEQFDGSYHFWFENRYLDKDGLPIEVCLLASIDDATGKITKAEFAKNEGVIAVFNFWKGYILDIGKPLDVYLDKFSTYKINHKSAVDNHEFMTQFQRAMRDLGINLISAHSAEAKGRVERLFLTLQDRLVKEMRLASINTPDKGNKFLKEVFIPKFNSKFAVDPAKEGNIHKALSEIDKKNLNRIFSVQSKRKVNNDFTIQFKNNWYQLTEIQPTTVRAKDRVLVEGWLNGTLHFSLREKYLNYTILPERPKKIKQLPLILTTHKLNWKPPQNHPWRQYHKTES